MIDKEKLMQLKHLLDENLITQEEFDTKKKILLGLEENNEESVKKVNKDEQKIIGAETESESNELTVIIEDDDSNGLKKKREALIGSNAEHYLPIFEKLDKGGSSWNWCAYFFTPIWYGYRKLYGWAIASLVVPTLTGFILAMILIIMSVDETSQNVILRVIGFAVNIFFAIKANSAYKKRIDKLIDEMPKDINEKNNYIESKGGVSVGAMIIFLVIYVALLAFNMYL